MGGASRYAESSACASTDVVGDAEDLVMYDDMNTCRDWGGKCCKRAPGCAFPEDFGLPNIERLNAALASGRWAIDWWEGDPRDGINELDQAFFIRPAIKGYEGQRYHASWGGDCTFLGTNGCELASEKRPRQCRQLEPKPNSNCVLHGDSDKQSAAISWLKYADALIDK